MNIARILSAAVLTTAIASAQEPQKPTPPAATQPTAGQESANRPLSPEERIAQVKKELDKLKAEKAFIDRVESEGGLPARVRDVVMDRVLKPQSTDDVGFKAPASQPSGANMPVSDVRQAQAPRKPVRLLGDAEKQRLGAEVVMTVDGLGITKAELEDVSSYFKSYTGEASDDALKTRAMSELIKERSVEAAFPETTAKALKKIDDANKALQSGKTFEDVAKEMSDCPSKAQGGDLNQFPREGAMDLLFAKAAFSQKVGETSKVVRTCFGYHIIKTTAMKKGAVPAKDEVRASHILALHHPDQMQVRMASSRVFSGQVDIAFANDEWRKLCPAEFK